MAQKYSADGSYVLVNGWSISPSTFTSFQDKTEGFTDKAILKNVRYLPVDSPESPLCVSQLDQANHVSRTSGMQCCVALWPDKVWAVLFFDTSFKRPCELQLLRAYRNARHAMRAVELSNLDVPEGSE